MNNSELINLNSGKEDWTTPRDLFDRLDAVYHFTLDPCSTHENALCEKHYTIAEYGLCQEWGGEIVFMNPPYNRKTGDWIRKAYRESLKGAVVICLVPARTDSNYWHNVVFPHAAEILFIKGRLHFSNSKDHAAFPSALIRFDSKDRGKYKDMSFIQEK